MAIRRKRKQETLPVYVGSESGGKVVAFGDSGALEQLSSSMRLAN